MADIHRSLNSGSPVTHDEPTLRTNHVARAVVLDKIGVWMIRTENSSASPVKKKSLHRVTSGEHFDGWKS